MKKKLSAHLLRRDERRVPAAAGVVVASWRVTQVCYCNPPLQRTQAFCNVAGFRRPQCARAIFARRWISEGNNLLVWTCPDLPSRDLLRAPMVLESAWTETTVSGLLWSWTRSMNEKYQRQATSMHSNGFDFNKICYCPLVCCEDEW